MIAEIRPVTFGRVLTGGALAGIAMIAYVYAYAAIAGVPLGSVASFTGALMSGGERAMWPGRIALAALALVWGALYAWARRWLPAAGWRTGLIYGLLVWLATTVVLLPILSTAMVGGGQPGLFGLGFGGLSALTLALTAHAVYGIVLGLYVEARE